MPDKTIGELLKKQRTERGMSLGDVANAAQISRVHLFRVETGVRQPKPEFLAAVCGVLEIPLADLYEAAGIPAAIRLPSIRPYLRRAYGMPEAAVDEMERYFQRITDEYGLPSDPRDGEDELPE
jgi:transcriptional regulator with XRE-family HTH domain